MTIVWSAPSGGGAVEPRQGTVRWPQTSFWVNFLHTCVCPPMRNFPKNQEKNPGWSSFSNGPQRRNPQGALSKTADLKASSLPNRSLFFILTSNFNGRSKSNIRHFSVSWKACSRLSTMHARPRRFYQSWWTSRTPRSPLAPPCRWTFGRISTVFVFLFLPLDIWSRNWKSSVVHLTLAWRASHFQTQTRWNNFQCLILSLLNI